MYESDNLAFDCKNISYCPKLMKLGFPHFKGFSSSKSWIIVHLYLTLLYLGLKSLSLFNEDLATGILVFV